MNAANKKEVLLHIVEDADDKLTGLLIALANEYNGTHNNYSDEEIKSFYQIRNNLLADPQSGYSPEEAHNLIKNKNVDGI